MSKAVKIWLAFVLLPIPLYLLVFIFGLVGLAGYWGYYMPLWDAGEPFFKYSTDTGWYYPTFYGNGLAVIIYSALYWLLYCLYQKVKRVVKNH